jgi:hypothetical protein
VWRGKSFSVRSKQAEKGTDAKGLIARNFQNIALSVLPENLPESKLVGL